MTIGYMDPLYRAWERMKRDLFQPFDPAKWMVVAFTSFLAGLVGGQWGGSGHSTSKTVGNLDPRNFMDFPSTAFQWLTYHPGWFLLILIVLFFLAALAVLLTWLSSRGKFMFLDNVVHNRAEVVLPWQRFKAPGNSLFAWRICFGLICLALVVALFVTGFVLFAAGFSRDLAAGFLFLPILGMSFLFLAVMVLAAYISLFLDSFIVPLMFRYDLSATQAWKRFLPLLKQYPGNFLLYGLFVAAMFFVVATGIVLAGCFTCCIGFILLIIPYIGSVILLPLTYTYRCLSLEFLGQFGPEFRIPGETETSIPPVLPADSCGPGAAPSERIPG